MRKFFSFCLGIILCLSVLAGCGSKVDIMENENEVKEKLNIVTSNFAAYDFLRAIGGDKIDITFLMSPGVDNHSYEPSPNDIIKIQNSDLFVYVGGEMEPWADSVIDSSSGLRTLVLSDSVNLNVESEVEGAEEHEHDKTDGLEAIEYDYHIWTSLDNAKGLVTLIANVLSEMDVSNSTIYTSNALAYNAEIQAVEDDIQSVIANSTLKTLVFGDKMPMQYFMNEFGLKPVAAFNGCSTETEPSATTIAYLVNYIKEHNIPVVLYCEMSTGSVAKSIADECGIEAMRIQSLHNVSKADFEAGYTYVDLMRQNLNVLKKALQ